jgi:hypothetical protein
MLVNLRLAGLLRMFTNVLTSWLRIQKEAVWVASASETKHTFGARLHIRLRPGLTYTGT